MASVWDLNDQHMESRKKIGWSGRLGQEVEMSSVMGIESLRSLQYFPLERPRRESLEYLVKKRFENMGTDSRVIKFKGF